MEKNYAYVYMLVIVVGVLLAARVNSASPVARGVAYNLTVSLDRDCL